MTANTHLYIKEMLRTLGRETALPYIVTTIADEHNCVQRVGMSPSEITKEATQYIEKLENDVNTLSQVKRILDAAQLLNSDNSRFKFIITYEHMVDNVKCTDVATIYAIHINEAIEKLREADTAFCNIKSYKIEG